MKRDKNARTRHLSHISVAHIIKRLNAFVTRAPCPCLPRKRVDGELVLCAHDDPDAVPCEMTPDQIRAATLLLGKVIPDIRAIEVTEIERVTDLDALSTEELMQLARGILPERLHGGMVDKVH